jgi:hypothetical protein
LNWDDEKCDKMYFNALAAQRGTDMHELAYRLIRLGVRLPDESKTLNMYVNDGIGFRMTPEQMLFYSINCFGTADTISFRDRKLRVSDFKNGIHTASIDQLKIYAAIFCLEYKHNPFEIEFELRIYQNNEVRFYPTEGADIFRVMDRIITFDKRVREIREEL